MERKPKRPIFLIVGANDLANVVEEESDDSEASRFKPRKEDEHLLDKLQSPVVDSVLIALRKSFSLAYPDRAISDSEQHSLMEIRRLSSEALGTMPDVLKALRLKPVSLDPNREGATQGCVFKFVIARASELKTKVLCEGKKTSLLEIIEHWPADDLVIALRKVLTLTFSEVFHRHDCWRLLREIRELVGDVLVDFNEVLEHIEVEPVAKPVLRGELDDEDEDDTEEDEE